MRSKTAAVSFRLTDANPPLSSASSRRLLCDSRISLLNEDGPMPVDRSVWSANPLTVMASSPVVASPRGFDAVDADVGARHCRERAAHRVEGLVAAVHIRVVDEIRQVVADPLAEQQNRPASAAYGA